MVLQVVAHSGEKLAAQLEVLLCPRAAQSGLRKVIPDFLKQPASQGTYEEGRDQGEFVVGGEHSPDQIGCASDGLRVWFRSLIKESSNSDHSMPRRLSLREVAGVDPSLLDQIQSMTFDLGGLAQVC